MSSDLRNKKITRVVMLFAVTALVTYVITSTFLGVLISGLISIVLGLISGLIAALVIKLRSALEELSLRDIEKVKSNELISNLHVRISSLNESQTQLRNLEEQNNDFLVAVKGAKVTAGYCYTCRNETLFREYGPWLRDQLCCTICYSIPRQRNIMRVLSVLRPDWEELKIHESSPSNDFVSRYSSNYSSSQLLDGTLPGKFSGGVMCQNLEELTFPDNTFDVFITQDVFEHIFSPDKAAMEITRVLKPGGIHIFTVPRNKELKSSRPRARMETDSVTYLLPPEYHGNPVGDGKSLVTWDYGSDFEETYESWSNSQILVYKNTHKKYGIRGKFLDVFVATASKDIH